MKKPTFICFDFILILSLIFSLLHGQNFMKWEFSKKFRKLSFGAEEPVSGLWQSKMKVPKIIP